MFYWAIGFFLAALIAGTLGFSGVAGAAGQITGALFFVFAALFIATLVVGIVRRPPKPHHGV